jgi:anthranilate phosphoribosyltransferase
MKIQEAIMKLVGGKSLTEGESFEVLGGVLDGHATAAQTGGFLTALRINGLTADELTGAAKAVRKRIQGITGPPSVMALDREEIHLDQETILGTSAREGMTRIFNISTAAAFVMAGAGVPVAKFGLRSASAYCGSEQVLSNMGILLDLTPSQLERCLRQIGIGFLYSSTIQNGLGKLLSIREEMGIRTLLNFLGPLANPAGARIQVLGVYQPDQTSLIAEVLERLGAERALVVHGQDTLDEISVTGTTRIIELEKGHLKTYRIEPEDLGIKRASIEDIKGGDAKQNARIIEATLSGEPGPRKDAVLVNAGAGLYVAGKAKDLKGGMELAREVIDSGKALKKLNQLRDWFLEEAVYLRNLTLHSR